VVVVALHHGDGADEPPGAGISRDRRSREVNRTVDAIRAYAGAAIIDDGAVTNHDVDRRPRTGGGGEAAISIVRADAVADGEAQRLRAGRLNVEAVVHIVFHDDVVENAALGSRTAWADEDAVAVVRKQRVRDNELTRAAWLEGDAVIAEISDHAVLDGQGTE